MGWQRAAPVNDVAVRADGTHAVAVDEAGRTEVWDLASATPAGVFTADGPLRACAISGDGRTVVAGGVARDVHLLRLAAAEAEA